MSSVTYSSTRGGQKNLDFRTVVMTGLARDRGLFVPDSIPQVTKEELESWRSLSYSELATQVISKYVQDDQVPADKLEDIVSRSCAAFRHEDVTPVVSVGGHKILVSILWKNEWKCSTHTHACSYHSLSLLDWIGTLPWTHLCV
jgi:threonine synthase